MQETGDDMECELMQMASVALAPLVERYRQQHAGYKWYSDARRRLSRDDAGSQDRLMQSTIYTDDDCKLAVGPPVTVTGLVVFHRMIGPAH
eukprot:5640553-Prymnesium_polylepis.1